MTDKIIRLPEVINKVGIKESTIYKHIKLGDFPAPKKIVGRTNGWLESVIDEWIRKRAGIEPANDGRQVAA